MLQAGLRISLLYLDKGFAGISVQQWLLAHRQPAIIACPIRGRTGGTRALCAGRESYRTRYTFQNEATAHTAELAVCRVRKTAKRTGRMKPGMEWMIFILVGLNWMPE